MTDALKLAALGLVAQCMAIAANWAHDLAYRVHALILMFLPGGMAILLVRRADAPARVVDRSGYMDDVVRAGVNATVFWGVVGFLLGIFIALQRAFPALNLDWAQPYANFGRLRPLHTSAVIFAFGGNVPI